MLINYDATKLEVKSELKLKMPVHNHNDSDYAYLNVNMEKLYTTLPFKIESVISKKYSTTE